jgi:hypothetical protein
MSAARVKRHALMAASVLLAATGCYEHAVSEGQSVYTFAPWVVALTIVAGLLLTVLGWLLRRGRSITSDRGLLGSLLMGLAGPLALLVLASSLCRDRVTVNDHEAQVATGFWCAQTTRSIQFDDLAELKLVFKRSENARNPGRVDRELVCVGKDARVRIVPVGDLLGMAVEEVIQKAQARGVNVSRQDHTR